LIEDLFNCYYGSTFKLFTQPLIYFDYFLGQYFAFEFLFHFRYYNLANIFIPLNKKYSKFIEINNIYKPIII